MTFKKITRFPFPPPPPEFWGKEGLISSDILWWFLKNTIFLLEYKFYEINNFSKKLSASVYVCIFITTNSPTNTDMRLSYLKNSVLVLIRGGGGVFGKVFPKDLLQKFLPILFFMKNFFSPQNLVIFCDHFR